MGLPDPHDYGSGNPGATNVLRTGNKLAAILTLVGDGAKGWLVVLAAEHFGGRFNLSDLTIPLVVLAVFLGHLFPIYFRFRGGKGVATAGGILFAIDWRIGLATLTTWLIIAFFFRYSSLAALVAAIFAPLFYVLIFGFDAFFPSVALIGLLLIWRHRENIRKLLEGTESRLGAKRTERV